MVRALRLKSRFENVQDYISLSMWGVLGILTIYTAERKYSGTYLEEILNAIQTSHDSVHCIHNWRAKKLVNIFIVH